MTIDRSVLQPRVRQLCKELLSMANRPSMHVPDKENGAYLRALHMVMDAFELDDGFTIGAAEDAQVLVPTAADARVEAIVACGPAMHELLSKLTPMKLGDMPVAFARWLVDDGFTNHKVDDYELGPDAVVTGHLHADGSVHDHRVIWGRFLAEERATP